MTGADIAISAGGSTCWELAFLGLPALFIVTADNQRGIAQGLGEAGAAVNLGWAGDLEPARLSQALTTLLYDRTQREEMSLRARQMVDGLGANRVLKMAWP